VHVELARALVRVLHDLSTSGGPVPEVVDEEWSDSPGDASARLRSPDGSGYGVRVGRGDPDAEQLASVADQVQEWAVEELWHDRPTNWPRCPEHPDTHPLQATVVDGAAWWACPHTGDRVARIGSLGSAQSGTR
jgi:hypothetical protein